MTELDALISDALRNGHQPDMARHGRDMLDWSVSSGGPMGGRTQPEPPVTCTCGERLFDCETMGRIAQLAWDDIHKKES